MILTDREIRIFVNRGTIVIDPPPDPETAYSSTSVDLTLGPTITLFNVPADGLEHAIDPSRANFRGEQILASITRHEDISADGYLLQPGILVLGWTKEYVNLKYDARLAARVEGKSSLARLGLAVHVTAPTIHSGFDGRVRLEIVNHGVLPIRLRPGMRVCQLIFEQTLGTPEKGYQGQFAGQMHRVP
jgi:dCTP deaminase